MRSSTCWIDTAAPCHVYLSALGGDFHGGNHRPGGVGHRDIPPDRLPSHSVATGSPGLAEHFRQEVRVGLAAGRTG